MKRLVLSISIFVVLVITLGAMLSKDVPIQDWWRRGRPPHPYLLPSDLAGKQLASTSPDAQFPHTFYYGEECGRLLSLADAAKRGRAVPKDLRTHFFDGVGHGYTAPIDDINATVSEIETSVPGDFAISIHDGVLRHFTMENKGDPAKVVPFAERYARLAGLPEPYNGVRIGLQRVLGDSLSEAIGTASEYPEAYWPALFEELGWRSSGHRPKRGANAPRDLLRDDTYWSEARGWVLAHAKLVPDASLCHYLHGAIRGRALRYPWQDAQGWLRFQDEIEGFDRRCRTAAFQGIAWAVFIHSDHRPEQVTSMMSSISDQPGRTIAEQTYARIQESVSGEEHKPLAPWDLAGVGIENPGTGEDGPETETGD